MNHHEVGGDPLVKLNELLEKRRMERVLHHAARGGYWSGASGGFSSRAYFKHRRDSIRRSILKRVRRLGGLFFKRGSRE